MILADGIYNGGIADWAKRFGGWVLELAGRGCRLAYPAVRRYVAKRLAAAGTPSVRANAAQPPAPPPSAKQLAFDWVKRLEDREEEQRARLEAIRGQATDLAAALDLADELASLIRKQTAGTLSDWLRGRRHQRARSCVGSPRASDATRRRWARRSPSGGAMARWRATSTG